MIALLLLLIILLHGLAVIHLYPKIPGQVKFFAGFIVGFILYVSFIYWTACLIKSLDVAIVLFFFFSIQLLLIFHRWYFQSIQFLKEIKLPDWTILLCIFLFSYYLFSKTFGYDSINGNFLVASNVYLDFGAHIPFIRSFSLGNNFPGEVPFFQNTGLLYYFLFDFYTGILEHFGFRIDIAYNLLSAISFTSLIVFIYYVTQEIFKKKTVSVLSVLFFLFSGDLSFLTFFKKYGLNSRIFFNWWHNNFYGTTAEVFWNLNTYMNQRHLIFGAAFFFLLIFFFLHMLKAKKISKIFLYILGISLGLLVMWHAMVFLAMYMLSCIMLIIYKPIRKQLLIVLFIGFVVGLPQLILIKLHSANTIVFQPGFLLSHMLTFKNEFVFWFDNLGLGLFIIPISFFLVNKEQKKFFLIFLPLFLIPNLVHLSSRYVFDDHKYFNLWIIGMNMFSAFVIFKVFSKNTVGKLAAVAFVILLTLSGIISIMVIKNDVFATLQDYPKNIFLTKALALIPSNTTVMTNGEIYDPITLIGKKTLIGRVEYVFVYGADASRRLEIQQHVLQPLSNIDMLRTVQTNHINYLVLYKNNFAKNEKTYNSKFYKDFKKLYEDNNGIIYKI